jgi:two-component system, sensor histidine kinase and response regulator
MALLLSVVIGASVFYFIARHEETAWDTRQHEAVRHAVVTLEAFIQRTRDSLVLTSLLGREVLAAGPELLQRFLRNNPALREIIRLDESGRVVAGAHDDGALLANLFTIPQSKWFQTAREGFSYLGKVEISSSNEPYLIMSIPAPDGGVVGVRISAAVLWDEVRDLKFGETGIAYIVNEDGRIIAHPDTQLVLAWTTLQDRPEMQALLHAPQHHWHGRYVNFRNVAVQAITAEIAGTKWVVIAELPRSEALAVSRAALFLLDAGIMLFSALMIGIIGLDLKRLVFQPLEHLRGGAERIGQGDLNHRIAIIRHDEVGEVGQAFNDMARRLAEREEQLEARTEALTGEIAERREVEKALQVAKDHAEAANRAKSEFLARMSHEIRTPMNGVLGMNELLLSTPLTERQRRFAETVQSSGVILLEIINDILDISKIEAGKLELDCIDFNLHDMVYEVIELLRERAHQKELDVACLIHQGVPPQLRGDPARLRQILTNLVGNGIKFTAQGEVVVTVEQREEQPDSVLIQFEVEDTGIGIPRESQRQIFEAFTQADGSTTRKFGGTGLGLAIARQLSAMMGGESGVESEPGRGARFWFTARFAKAPAAFDREAPAGNGVTGLKVLLVEDKPKVRKILAQQLNSYGIRTEDASTGVRALEMLRGADGRSGCCDLAVVDMTLPDMTGLELAEKVRADAAIQQTPLIVLAPAKLLNNPVQLDQAGVTAYLAKPARPDELFQCMVNAVATGATTFQSKPRQQQAPPPGTSRQQRRVLVAEDNLINQEFVKLLLEMFGLHVDVVANGLEALQALEHGRYDLVFMDCQMPEMDGYQASAIIRNKRAEGATLPPVVALTAHALKSDRERCLAEGMDDYLCKPFTMEGMQTILERWLPGIEVPTAAARGAVAD